ncbi:MAG: hypothetical protein JO309_00520 [Pseudonocardiales bacterium]|nr:hypothetical protein [Pseudonocardiales bacterium]MBV9727903.1 hypothetical protein [Pseudonocardiales bacterium]
MAKNTAEACSYLLAVDVDMNTVDGYAMTSWERGVPRHPEQNPADDRLFAALRAASAGR